MALAPLANPDAPKAAFASLGVQRRAGHPAGMMRKVTAQDQ